MRIRQVDEKELTNYLRENYPKENELCEWKAWTGNFSISGKQGDDLGSYVSAIANQNGGHLIIGAEDKTLNILGIKKSINAKKTELEVLNKTYPNHTISIEEITTSDTKKRIWIIKIPKHSLGQEIVFQNKAYQRNKDSIISLTDGRKNEIRSESKKDVDWSSLPCKELDISHLDEKAMTYLRKKVVNAKKDKRFLKMPTKNLLNCLGLTTDGFFNNTCMLFLCKTSVSDLVISERNKISWRYADEKNEIEERMSIEDQKAPLILTIERVKLNINRFNVLLKDLDLFRTDIRQYDEKAIEELLINSLAHRDWTIPFWIEIVQTPNSLEFRNPGKFRADLDKVLMYNESVPYLNPRLTEFFQHIKLMEKERGGLQKVYSAQLKKGVTVKKRELDGRVDFVLSGKVENEDFAKLVLNKTDIEFEDLLVLDKIASGKNSIKTDIDIENAKRLKKKGLIELGYTRCYISKTLSKTIGKTGWYVAKKGLKKQQMTDLIQNHIKEYGAVKLENLREMFPDLNDEQRKNLLARNKKDFQLIRKGRTSDWYYVENTNI